MKKAVEEKQIVPMLDLKIQFQNIRGDILEMLTEVFHLADDVLRQAVQGITELITEPGLINVDFAHVRRLILLGGGALMSIGHGQGETKAVQALEQALHHPLVEDVSLCSAAGVIANFSGGQDLSLFDVQTALSSLQERTGAQTVIVWGDQ